MNFREARVSSGKRPISDQLSRADHVDMSSKSPEDRGGGDGTPGPVPPASEPFTGSAPPPPSYPPPPPPFDEFPPPPPRPPLAPPPPVARQLVRDPYTRLGGVASGIGQHYGVDVSLVRIAFVVFTLATGFGIIIYLLSWLIIPRAEYWPPVAAAKPIRALSGREIGIGLVLLGLLVALFFTGGALSKVLVPLVLIGGGVWLLLQPDSEETLVGSRSRPQAASPVDTVRVDSASAGFASSGLGDSAGFENAAGYGYSVPPEGSMPRGTPVVAPRRRWRRRLLWAPVVFIAAIPVIGIILLATVDINIDFAKVNLKPLTVEALPGSINEEQAELVVDLSELDAEMFDGGARSLDVALEIGSLEIIVPEDLQVAVEADVSIGNLEVFESSEDGIGPEITIDNADADLVIDATVDIGELIIRRSEG